MVKKKKKEKGAQSGQRHAQTFHWRGYTDGNKHMKKMLNITSHLEMQIKTVMRYHYTPVQCL